MRLSTAALVIASFGLVTALGACGGDDDGGEAYDDLPTCVDDHVEEGLAEAEAIAHCLVDFDFGQDFTDQAGCVAYVTDNGGYPDSRDEACTDYFEEV